MQRAWGRAGSGKAAHYTCHDGHWPGKPPCRRPVAILCADMSTELVCWRCGASLAALSLPLRRLEECPGCRAELHVCRMCAAYDPRVARKCREDDAEDVKNKEQANFCDYFRPRTGAFDAALAKAEQQAHDSLSALFGQGNTAAESPVPSPANALFGRKPLGEK